MCVAPFVGEVLLVLLCTRCRLRDRASASTRARFGYGVVWKFIINFFCFVNNNHKVKKHNIHLKYILYPPTLQQSGVLQLKQRKHQQLNNHCCQIAITGCQWLQFTLQIRRDRAVVTFCYRTHELMSSQHSSCAASKKFRNLMVFKEYLNRTWLIMLKHDTMCSVSGRCWNMTPCVQCLAEPYKEFT